ncbi:hypothetical protein [Pelagerythrobacter aerophilus]
MMFIMALLLICVLFEILGAALALCALLDGRIHSPLGQVVPVSIVSTLIAWAVPTESWLGLTVRTGWFEPWSASWTVAFWALIGVPSAIMAHRKVSA